MTNGQISAKDIKQLKENSNWYFWLGLVCVVIGAIALFYSYTTTIFSVLYLGIMLILIGAIEAFQSFKINLWSNFFLHIFVSIFYIVSGIFIVTYPTLSAINLTLIAAFFFIISGIAKMFFAYSQKVAHKNLLAFSGLLTFILGILIWAQWPFSGLWVIGFLVAVDTIFTGIYLIRLSLVAQDLKIKK